MSKLLSPDNLATLLLSAGIKVAPLTVIEPSLLSVTLLFNSALTVLLSAGVIELPLTSIEHYY